jgi:hypothetical protein
MLTVALNKGALSGDGIIEIQGPLLPPESGLNPWLIAGLVAVVIILALLLAYRIKKGKPTRCMRQLRLRLAGHAPVRSVLHELYQCLPANRPLERDLYQLLQKMRFSPVEPDRQQAMALLLKIESMSRGRHAG